MQVFRGEYQPALDSYRKAVQRLEEAVCSKEDYLQLSRLHRLIGEVFEKLGQYPDAIDQLSQAQEILKLAGGYDPVEIVNQMHDLGWIQFRQGNLADAEQTFLEGLQRLEETRQPALYASLCNRVAGVYYQQSRFEDSIKYLQKSIVLRDKIGDQVAVSRSSNNLGLLQWKMGLWNDALASFQRSLKSHQQVGDVEGEVNVLSNLGLILMDRGDLPEAETHLTRALDQAKRLNLTYHEAMIHLHLSKYNYLTDQLDKAMKLAQKGSDLFAGIQSQEVLADLKVNEGLIWLARGDSGKARDCSEDAIRLADEVNGENKLTDDRARAYRLSAQVAMLENDLDLAISHLVLSDEIFQHTGDAIEQARNLVIRSELLTRLKKPGEANTLRQRAKTVFEQFGAKADLKRMSIK
jgi:tetratricopeptide (TPR) repeat protein